MRLEITKEEFDSAVPAAREPKGKVFGAMLPHIQEKLDMIALYILGDVGVNAVENGDSAVSAIVRSYVVKLACISAFVENMRSLDLVLTATGFGVVSTNDTAPASKMRVDALEEEQRRYELMARSLLLGQLFQLEGWNDTAQRRHCVDTLFYSFYFLTIYAGISKPQQGDWYTNVPVMMEADGYLRKHIGDDYMEELLLQMTGNKLTEDNKQICVLCQKYIGACIAQNQRLKSDLYMRLINLMEDNIDKYPTYANSKAYKLNHFKPYENHAEDSAFHFVG